MTTVVVMYGGGCGCGWRTVAGALWASGFSWLQLTPASQLRAISWLAGLSHS